MGRHRSKLFDNPLYGVWNSMKSRCTNPNRNVFHLYGGRGIRVCSRWQLFCNFLSDMGHTYRPGLTLDRIDGNGGYDPTNCRWATPRVQAFNRRVQARNRSGHKGVFIRDNKFRATIRIDGILHQLGTFSTLDEAIDARYRAERHYNVAV